MGGVCPAGYILVIEGLAKVCVPDFDLYRRPDGVYEPSLAPVFYNPAMVENRDITIAFLSQYLINRARRFVFLDPMAATGIRSIRFAIEVGSYSKGELDIFIGDISTKAIEIIKHNIELNNINEMKNVSVTVNQMDANEYMYYLRRNGFLMDYIDIDPFGSPAPFLFSALSCIKNGGVIGVTATDTAVLEGKYTSTLFRRYGVTGLKTSISKEIAIRALLSFIMRMASIVDKYIIPLLSYYFKHYVRVFIKVCEGAKESDNMLANCIGRAWYCQKCGYSFFESVNTEAAERVCPICKHRMTKIEPLWICKLKDEEYVKYTYDAVSKMVWLRTSSIRIIANLSKSYTLNPTIRISTMAKALKLNMPQREYVIKCLESMGYRVSQSMFYDDGIETDASPEDITKCILKGSSS